MFYMIARFNLFAQKHGLYRYGSMLIAVLILIFSVVPNIGRGINAGFGAHAVAYFSFSLITGLHFRASRAKSPLLKGAVLASLYGMLIEGIQHFIPYRFFELTDMAVNCAAAFLAVLPNAALIRTHRI
jgi:hypothetical protein